MMPRQFRHIKPLIYVFCEGESEQAYARFLHDHFKDIASINVATSTGLFEVAKNKFDKDKRYRDNVEITDEIWFFFDVEQKERDKWESYLRIIKQLRKLKGKPGIRVRLLMTTACLEYWLLLHFEKCMPQFNTDADKHTALKRVKEYEPQYAKGNLESTSRIAVRYSVAVRNAAFFLRSLESVGLPGIDDTDIRNTWLIKSCMTFSTVFEAIEYLEGLKRT